MPRQCLLGGSGVPSGELAVLGGIGDDPCEELGGVVEAETDLLGLGGGCDGDVFVSRELNLFNKVLMGLRGKLGPFRLVQVDVVRPQGGVQSGSGLDTREVGEILELESYAELMVLHMDTPAFAVFRRGSRLYLKPSVEFRRIPGLEDPLPCSR